uniref:Uncharacterized protein n=1 Tax=Aliivibrio fischeri TaxID=668 RepID=H2ES53_ALIFS|nr:hypothetical protein [Aliivibrio fischeri]AEY78220.1 hypothetical protein [Aliivibrio fischeri]
MLQFMKKWYQAFKEDKAVRLAKESVIEANSNTSTSNFWQNWSDGENAYYDEQQRKGNYY